MLQHAEACKHTQTQSNWFASAESVRNVQVLPFRKHASEPNAAAVRIQRT